MRSCLTHWRLILFWILLGGVAAAALFFGSPLQRRYSARKMKADIPKFNLEEVAQISVVWRNVHSTMKIRDGRWFLAERQNRPASVPRISALLNSLSTISPVKELSAVTPELLKDLHLQEGDPKSLPGVSVRLANARGKELFRILLGKGHFVRTDPGLPPSQDAEGRYVKIAGRVYLIPLVFENCHPLPAAWVEPLRLYELRKALKMSMSRFENGKGKLCWAVYRRSTAHPFTLAYPVGKTADNQLLSGLAERLSKPFTSDYFTPEKNQEVLLKQRLSIHCADGFSYQLELSDGSERYDVAALKVEYEPARVQRYPGENTDQFELRKKKLRKRFDFENGFTAGVRFITSKELSGLLDVVPEKKRK